MGGRTVTVLTAPLTHHQPVFTMAYTWDNRVKYIVRYMYDIDNNGFLDKNDFDCLALRTTLIENRGDVPADALAKNKAVMLNLWNELAALADFDKDGEVTVEEFKKAVQGNCKGKAYNDFPVAFKAFIANQFKTIDVNGGGISIERYQELYAQFLSSEAESNACYLFGP